MTDQKTYYVTKFALTTGIMAVKGEISGVSPNMLGYTIDGWPFTSYAHGREWHDNFDDAIADCERRRKAKLESLKKQIAKLEKMEFTL